MMRARILAEARSWLGTPYEHQASCKGAGTDCLGLVRGIWRALYGAEPAPVPAYTPDWAEPSQDEVLLRAMARYFVPVSQAKPGDILVFRIKNNGVAKHLAVLSGPSRIIHAYSGRGVVETPLSSAWKGRIAGVFRFPEGRE